MSGRVHAEAKAPPTSASSFIPVQSRLLQRKSLLDGMSGLMGEFADSHGKQLVSKPPLIQAKLTICQPHDRYEQEADRVAEQVLRMPEVQRRAEEEEEEKKKEGEEFIQMQPLAGQITPLVQRQLEIEEEEEEILQTKAHTGQTAEVAPTLESRIQSLRGGGQLLPPTTRIFFEPRFGYDFSRVRIHTDARGTEMVRWLNARAFTIGNNIVFDRGQYDPQTMEGKRLIAHELVHVIQQRTHQVQTIMRTCNCDAIPNGRDPSPIERIRLEDERYERLGYGDYCITGPITSSYNCFALTINARTHVQSEIDTDRDYRISFSEAERFYRFHGFSPVSDRLNADLVLYGPNRDDIKHGAIRIPQTCAGTRMFESKLGPLWKIAHFPEQLEGRAYGTMQLFYRRQRMTPAERLAPIRLPTPTMRIPTPH